MVNPIQSLRAGETIAGRYRLTDALGHSDAEVLWRASAAQDADAVELRVLGALRPGVSLASALDALRGLQQVRHLHLAPVVDVVEHADAPVVVYRASDGVPLTAWIAERAAVGVGARASAARDVIDQVAQALAAAHRMPGAEPWAHGALDITSVRVERRGGTISMARVEGLGLTRVARPPAGWLPPPEGPEPSPRADVFALGRLVVRLLSDDPPGWEPATLRAWWERRGLALHDSLASAALACLDPDPAKRPADARHARDLLRRARWELTERELSTPSPSPRREPAPAPSSTPAPTRAAVVEVRARTPAHGTESAPDDATVADDSAASAARAHEPPPRATEARGDPPPPPAPAAAVASPEETHAIDEFGRASLGGGADEETLYPTTGPGQKVAPARLVAPDVRPPSVPVASPAPVFAVPPPAAPPSVVTSVVPRAGTPWWVFALGIAALCVGGALVWWFR